MDQAIILILGYMGPIIVIGLISILIKLYINKKEQSQPQ